MQYVNILKLTLINRDNKCNYFPSDIQYALDAVWSQVLHIKLSGILKHIKTKFTNIYVPIVSTVQNDVVKIKPKLL